MSFLSYVRWNLFLVGLMVFMGASLAQAENFSDFKSSVYTGPHKIKAIDTEHFTLEYSVDIAGGADADGDSVPDLVENLAHYAEFSWDKEVTELGFPDPLEQYADYKKELNQSRIFLILDDVDFYLLDGSVGVTSVLFDGSLYMAVDPSISNDLLKVTVAHEFLHVIQFSYQGDFIGYDQDLNFAEQTAVAIEDYVFDEVDDYWNYLHHYFDYPDYSILTGVVPEGSLFEYGLVIWPRFLVEYFDDWTILPQVVQVYFDEPVPDVWDSFEAYKEIIEGEYDSDMGEVYQDFSLWNYLLSYYEEGENYPWPIIHATHDADELPLKNMEPKADFLPALFGTNYLQFNVDPSMWGKDIKFTFDKSVDIDLGVMVLPETETAFKVDEGRATIFLTGYDSGTLTVPVANDIKLFTIMVTPLTEDPSLLESSEDAFSIGYTYYYSVEVGEFIDGNDIEIGSFVNGVLSDGAIVKEGDEVGENLPEGAVDLSPMDALTVHELDITSYDDSSVSLSWSRLQGTEGAGYRVYYGTESGDYLFYEDVTGAHITHFTVKDLLSFDRYYFSVKGLDAEGVESAVFSNEVSVDFAIETISDPDELLGVKEFSDVPVSNKYYEAIHFLTEIEIFSGYPDETFQPNKTINRAELMKILAFSDLGEGELADYHDCFPDVQDEWFAPYVCYGKEMGWVQGYSDGLFHPERTVSRAEALKMIYESDSVEISSFVSTKNLPYEDIYSSMWFAPYVAQAYDDGLLENNGKMFGSDLGQSRAQVAEIIYRYFVLYWFEDDRPYTKELGNEFQAEWAKMMGM